MTFECSQAHPHACFSVHETAVQSLRSTGHVARIDMRLIRPPLFVRWPESPAWAPYLVLVVIPHAFVCRTA
jgi:hypothetical protein